MNEDLELLPEPIPISEQIWPENTIQLVSISCLVYNHESYIKDAIDSFLIQKTTFPVKIVIFEDCSSDNTRSILREYEKDYPQLFKIFYQSTNTYNKSIRKKALKPRNEERNKGKYIAMCEGDDYWTDPLKLQKQVEFMEANDDCSMCYHAYTQKFINNYKPDKIIGLKTETDVKFSINGRQFIRMVTLLFKSEYFNPGPDWLSKVPLGDLALQLYLFSKGKAGYIAGAPMAVYNRGNPGAWSEKESSDNEENESKEWSKKRVEDFLNCFIVIHKNIELISKDYKNVIENEIHTWLYTHLFYTLENNSRYETYKTYKKYSRDLPFKIDKVMLKFWLRFVFGKAIIK